MLLTQTTLCFAVHINKKDLDPYHLAQLSWFWCVKHSERGFEAIREAKSGRSKGNRKNKINRVILKHAKKPDAYLPVIFWDIHMAVLGQTKVHTV